MDAPTVDRRPSTADRRPPTADRRPPTADRRPPTADRRPPTADRQRAYASPRTVGRSRYVERECRTITICIAGESDGVAIGRTNGGR
jgi:hypothetical protein